MIENNPYVTAPDWDLPDGVQAFYTHSAHQESLGDYAGFNLAQHVGDDPLSVQENRRLLPYNDRIAWLKQTHSNRCVHVTEQVVSELEGADADASFTKIPKTICAVLTADCLPILVANQQGTAVAAIHAGWRGLANGILENTLNVMPGPVEELMVWVGPHISQQHFQVGEEVKSAFSQYPDAFKIDETADGEQKYLGDLAYIAKNKCNALNVGAFQHANICTYEHSAFYSYRAAKHLGQTETGRFLCGIFLK